jgi:hypothetical protein
MAGFSKIYDGRVRAVDAVAMEIRHGEFLLPARPLGLWQDHTGDRQQEFSFNLVIPRGDHPSQDCEATATNRRMVGPQRQMVYRRRRSRAPLKAAAT